MLEQYFSNRRAIGGYREEPLGSYVDGFVKFLGSQGYTRYTIRLAVQVLGHFNRWLRRRRFQADQVSAELIGRFLRRPARPEAALPRERAALNRLLEHLQRLGIAVPSHAEHGADVQEQLVEEFGRYLQRDRALSPATIAAYCPHVRRFLSECLGAGNLELERLSVSGVQEFVLHHARGRTAKSTQLTLSAVRSFLRFLYLRGQIALKLAEHVPTVAAWRQAEPPKWLPPEDIQRVLDTCDRRSACGQRDYAILLLLARLGLRAGEIVSLELDDIHWEAAEIRVCGKGRQRKCFPLTAEVGLALASYLKNARPRCNSRRVFLRAKAPHRGLANSSTLDAIVSRALKRAGLEPPLKGAHLFRHSLATNMLRNGATLTEIGQILHHTNPDTTSIYAKVDLAGLRAVARPWPGEHV